MPQFKMNNLLALGGLIALTLLAYVGKVEAAAVVTFLGGLFVNPEGLK
jgi:hypothetical protein